MIEGTYFKYVTAEAAHAIVTRTSLRWSAPALFNDPFDMDTEPRWLASEAELSDDQIKRIGWSQDPSLGELGPDGMLALRRELAVILSRYHDPFLRLSLGTKNRYSKYLHEARVLCLTKNPSSLLMWAHYADSHRGLLLGFIADRDGGFCGAKIKDVQYSSEVPRAMEIGDFFSLPIKGIPKGLDLEVFRKIVLTKSIEWAYESECRCVTFAPDSPNRAEIPFNPSRLVSVVYGLRTPESDIIRIDEAIAKDHTYCAKRYRARRRVAQFALDYAPM